MPHSGVPPCVCVWVCARVGVCMRMCELLLLLLAFVGLYAFVVYSLDCFPDGAHYSPDCL